MSTNSLYIQSSKSPLHSPFAIFLSVTHLFHHLAEELVFPLRCHVILPTQYIQQCPWTTITVHLRQVAARNASFHFQSKGCAASPISLSSFPSRLFHGSFFHGLSFKDAAHSQPFITFSTFHFCALHSHFLVCPEYELWVKNSNMRRKNNGWKVGWTSRCVVQ